MKRNLILIAILVVVALIGCPKKPRHTVASESQPSSVAQPAPAPATPPPPPAPAPTPPPVAPLPAAPAGPNMSITFNTNFLKDVLGGLCSTGYQIYLGDPQNYIIFRELKTLQNIPASGEVEVSMRMDVAIKKYGIPYKDQAEATIRLKLTTARKNNDIILRGDGRLISRKTSFGPKLDENILLPLTNKAITKGPLFEVPLSDISHVLIPWPKLGDSPRVTQLNLNDASVEIQPAAIVFHMYIVPQTKKP